MNLPKHVEIVEVSPRDGLQMLPHFVPTANKIKLIELLKNAGLKRIEAVSFVSPKYVPQMADAGEILQAIGDDPQIAEVALALNEKGYKRAIEAKVNWICYVMAATETFSRKNANTTIAEALHNTKNCIAEARQKGIKVRASISVTWICPYEGEVSPSKVLDLTAELVKAGADEIAYNDTVGRAVPNRVFDLCKQAQDSFPDQQFAAHFHDTNSTALANIYAALCADWKIFDSSAGGLGGCPFSPGATGNVATEKVVWMLEKMGISTGIDFEKLKICADFAARIKEQAG